MFAPKENLYINTLLNNDRRGIWTGWFIDGYKVYVERMGRYVIEFETHKQAIDFNQRITASQNVGTSMKDGVIVMDIRDNNAYITIDCGKNEELAIKLTKHLRKQWVLIRRQQLKQQAIEQQTDKQIKKQEIEDMGIKF